MSGVRRAACSVRPFLPELVGDQQAAVLDEELARLLAQPVSPANDESLRHLLVTDRATELFLAGVLEDAPRFRPRRVRDEPTRDTREYTPLAGTGFLDPPRYICPLGPAHFEWFKVDTQPVPPCPQHHQPLQPAPPDSDQD